MKSGKFANEDDETACAAITHVAKCGVYFANSDGEILVIKKNFAIYNSEMVVLPPRQQSQALATNRQSQTEYRFFSQCRRKDRVRP